MMGIPPERVDRIAECVRESFAALGVLVGGLVIAMYLPIFKLGAVV